MLKMSRLVFCSPIPPAKSGTAAYFADLIREIRPAIGDFEKLIICDAPGERSVGEIPVYDYQDYRPRADDILFLFVANNGHHEFVHRVLRQSAQAKVVVVIHDLSIIMAVEKMIRKSTGGAEPGTFEQYTKCEPTLSDWFGKERRLPHFLKYFVMCQSPFLKRASAIITHSHYAALRLLCERKPSSFKAPILVMQMPERPTEEQRPVAAEGSRFKVGVFGWITPPKRPVEVMKGFIQFLGSLPLEEQSAPEIKFVGEASSGSYEQIVSLSSGITRQVRLTGYLSSEAYKKELLDCDCYLNLRFPSCGETSATLNELASLNRPFAVSKYQAFSEECATRHISIDPKLETKEIAEFISDSYVGWKRKIAPPPPIAAVNGLPKKFAAGEAIRKAIEIATAH